MNRLPLLYVPNFFLLSDFEQEAKLVVRAVMTNKGLMSHFICNGWVFYNEYTERLPLSAETAFFMLVSRRVVSIQ